MPGRPPTIALDGPGAAGKSTAGRRVAEALGYLFFDTGVLYRALTHAALATGMSLDDGPALAVLAEAHPAEVQPLSGRDPGYTVWVDGTDVTAELRAPEVDRAVSAVSRQAEVRSALLAAQRRIAGRGEVLLVGRDIGTVVLPDADLKLYLDASATARARRRHAELVRHDPGASYDAVLTDLIARDQQDSARALAPLAIAPDAVVVNTDACDIGGVVAHLLSVIARWPDELTTLGGSAPCRGDGPA